MGVARGRQGAGQVPMAQVQGEGQRSPLSPTQRRKKGENAEVFKSPSTSTGPSLAATRAPTQLSASFRAFRLQACVGGWVWRA